MARSLRSVTAGGRDKAKDVARAVLPVFGARFPTKYWWFITKGYNPHEWQAAFHSADHNGRLARFRHLVAGRRGGKTLSAAWEVVFYSLFPREFHLDAHGVDSDRPLWGWILTKDHKVGFPAEQAIKQVLNQAGLVKDKDYKWNKSEKLIEFANGSIIQFKTAEDPQSLRGAGLDWLWMDEAAFIPTKDAYIVVRPALSDKIGLVITTTTPHGKNWFWEEFWSDKAWADPNNFRVEYTSIDNPYFAKAEWEWALENYHPIFFKQEYLASFDALSGIDLDGAWLHYYSLGKPDQDEIALPRDNDGQIKLRKFIGVDPSVGLQDDNDSFAMCLVGIAPDNTQAFILKTLKDRIPFPDQITKIQQWFLEYRPEFIGIESNAFQRVLEQQASRLEGMPPTVPIISRGKKFERILSMAPTFKIGKIRIHRTMSDFVDEWVNYDSSIRNPKDDLLDATEIALSAAGILLPSMDYGPGTTAPTTLDEEATAAVAQAFRKKETYDPELGSEA